MQTVENQVMSIITEHHIAVLIPCKNEAMTVKKVIDEYREQLPDATFYVYDNNSTDDTARIAREAGAVVTKIDGRSEMLPKPISVCAANPVLHEKMLKVIAGE